MPTVTYDGRSFMLDGRRLWIVSGTVCYARLCREQWAERLHWAKLAGLNTIETPVIWSKHEPRPGKFDFSGENDLRAFLKLAHEEGLHVILRVGPFAGADWDLGGLPAWLLEAKGMKLRTNYGPFLEACSRFLGALADQVQDLQITSPGKPGPLLLVQNECNWSCGHDALAHSYLLELNRYLREAGLNVPVVNSNNLWQSVEGEIDAWSGGHDLLPTVRQLGTVRPDQPRLVIDLPLADAATWNAPAPTPDAAWLVQRSLAEALAAGGQFNINPFAGGINFGHTGGRSADAPASFSTAEHDRGAPIGPSGSLSPHFAMVRRLTTFASRFSRVFSALDPTYLPISLHPAGSIAKRTATAAGKKSKSDAPTTQPISVIHASGSQGGVVYVFAGEPTGERRDFDLLLPEGTTLPVSLKGQSVAWCLFDAHLTPRSHLDYCNLNAFAVVGKLLVCFGPADSRGVLSINGSAVELNVPAHGSAAPTLVEHEGLYIAALNEDQIDSAYATEEGLYMGVVGLTRDGRAIVAPGVKSYAHVSADGLFSQRPSGGSKTVPPAGVLATGGHEKITLGDWLCASTEDYTAGESARYASIPGPTELASLGSPSGYGWYRLTLKNTASGKARVMIPQGADRLHLFAEGKPVGVVGVGPGAADHANLPLRKGTEHVVVLADNQGRFSGGNFVGESKGLFGHLLECEEIKAGKPKVVRGQPVDLLLFRAPLMETQQGDQTEPDRLTWHFSHRKKTPVLMKLGNPGAAGLVIVDDRTVAYFDRSGPATIVLEPDVFTKGASNVQIALVAEGGAETGAQEGTTAGSHQAVMDELSKTVEFYDATSALSAKAEWSFAKWEIPPASAFKAGKPKTEGPAWWRTSFRVSATPSPLYLDAAGLTKGQIFVNGRHLSRFFVATADGTPVPPQSRYLIPTPWLKPAGQDNEITIFDEHGHAPSKCKLVVDHAKTPPTVQA